MDVIIVRHGESQANVEGRIQGHLDSPLSDLGRRQARRLADWLVAQGFEWDTAYCSPLARARETAEIIAERRKLGEPLIEPDLREIHAGKLEGLDREQMGREFPSFLEREITNLGDFAEYGGESYEEVQRRVRRLVSLLEERHRNPPGRVLVVAHGGINFQLVKAVTCVPVPRVSILRWGNCTASLLRFRERRGVYMAEVVWHVPLELMGGGAGEGSSALFR